MVARDRPMAAATPRGSPPTSVTSEASIATSAPVPIAMPEVRLGQRRRVVDPVADHRHRPTAALQPLDRGRLVRRQDLGEDLVGGDADLGGHGDAPSPGRRRSRARPRCRPRSARGRRRGASALTGSLMAMSPAARPSIATNAMVRLPADRSVPGRSRAAPRSTPRRLEQAPIADDHRVLPAVGAHGPHDPAADDGLEVASREPNPSSSRFARATIAAPSGCSLARSRAPARSSTVRSVNPAATRTSAHRRPAERQRAGLVEDRPCRPGGRPRAPRRPG